MLIGGADNLAQAGKLVEAGKYRFTINMEEMTYKIEAITRPELLPFPAMQTAGTRAALSCGGRTRTISPTSAAQPL